MPSEFHLPDEILAVIPTNPYDQLDVARKITAMAIGSRVADLESEVGKLGERVSERDAVVGELREEVTVLETRLREADARAKAAVEENAKLRGEKEILTLTVKRLNRDLTKLEGFKRQLMQSLNEDNSSYQAEGVYSLTCEPSSPKAPSVKDKEVHVSTRSGVLHGLTGRENTSHASSIAEEMYSLTPYISPNYTPAATPKVISITSPKESSASGSPKAVSSVASPTESRIDGKIVLSPWHSSSRKSSAVNSPPHGHVLTGSTARVDGKEFFKQTRNRLSYEQFVAFLANIKEFNAHKQSREETLKKAEEIFGMENRDLYSSFLGILNPNEKRS